MYIVYIMGIYSYIKSLILNIPLLCIFSDPSQILKYGQNGSYIWFIVVYMEWVFFISVFIGFEYEL